MTVEPCPTQWRLFPFRFWQFRNKWHQCTEPSSPHDGPHVCACGQRAPNLVLHR